MVECRSDSEYAERPLALTWEGQRLDVAEILRRWREPGKKAFWVRTTDERIFQLTYDEFLDQWEIQLK